MREILFKGKRTDNGEWVEGYFVEQNSPEYHTYIIRRFTADVNDRNIDITEYDIVEVIPSTVGQYIGLNDKNGTKVFEGDVVRSTTTKFVVVFEKNEFCLIPELYYKTYGSGVNCHILQNFIKEVIGNIHDNDYNKGNT